MDKLTKLKQAVHEVIGNHDHIQCKVVILPNEPIVYECTWQRLYEDAGLSDRRYCEGETLEIIFRKIIEYEARADVRDAEELAERLDAVR